MATSVYIWTPGVALFRVRPSVSLGQYYLHIKCSRSLGFQTGASALLKTLLWDASDWTWDLLCGKNIFCLPLTYGPAPNESCVGTPKHLPWEPLLRSEVWGAWYGERQSWWGAVVQKDAPSALFVPPTLCSIWIAPKWSDSGHREVWAKWCSGWGGNTGAAQWHCPTPTHSERNTALSQVLLI